MRHLTQRPLSVVLMTVLVVLIVPAAVPLAGADPVDDFVRAEMARQKVPGLALAIVREGKLIRAQGYGLANVEHEVAVTEHTVFQTGSVGKQFTAMAVMMLVEEGKMALDDPVTKYFDAAPAAWKAITVRHLLTHTSGLKDFESESAESGSRKPGTLDYRRDYTEDELAKVAMEAPLDFTPGTNWSYSNTGYVMLGIVIHKVSGQFYGDYLKARVFGPLGMASTRVISEADIVKHRAAGYQLVDGNLKNHDWVAPKLNTTADGSLYTTVVDLAAWDAALRTERLLPRRALREM